MVAASYQEMPPNVGERPGFDTLDPSTIDTEGDFVFALTSRRTSVATYTSLVVYYEAVVHVASRVWLLCLPAVTPVRPGPRVDSGWSIHGPAK